MHMSRILLFLGFVTAAAGLATVGFGIPINEFSLGTTLIVAGTTALVGGLILIGLSAVVTELGRVAEGLRARASSEASANVSASTSVGPGVRVDARATPAGFAGPQVPGAQVARPADLRSAPAAASVDASARAFEQVRSNVPGGEQITPEPSMVEHGEEVPLSPTAVPHHMGQQPNDSVLALRQSKTSDDRPGAGAVEALKASRLDFLFRSKPPQPPAQSANFDAFWPTDGRSGRIADSQTQTRTAGPAQEIENNPAVQESLPEASKPEQPRALTVLKSGIVDGMPYTLYADGSIEAKLPQGVVRFGSIAELRAHIESNS